MLTLRLFIQRRSRQMDRAHKNLMQRVGEKQATTILGEVFDRKQEEQE
ncbi:MAG TPA: hypothetical protein VKV19_01500 [Ktedonobacteraceae bacterium]|nr:hypothetical protein [Ktedonobacteraceae bacterium]